MQEVSLFLSQPSVIYWSSQTGRLLLGVLTILLGFFVASKVTHWLRTATRKLSQHEMIAQSPVGELFASTSGLRGTGIATMAVFWTVVFLFIAIAGEILGITLFGVLVAEIVSYLPSVLSAAIVLFLGIALAGVAENTLKKQLKRVMPQQAVLVGTSASYAILGLFAIMALSELGIASEFILILFGGLVFALSLGVGLALGLGSKDVVSDMLQGMIQDEKQRRSQATKGSKRDK